MPMPHRAIRIATVLLLLLTGCSTADGSYTSRGWLQPELAGTFSNGKPYLVVGFRTADPILRDTYEDHLLFCLPSAIVRQEHDEVIYHPRQCSESLLEVAELSDQPTSKQ